MDPEDLMTAQERHARDEAAKEAKAAKPAKKGKEE
jgi:hypothetical protein